MVSDILSEAASDIREYLDGEDGELMYGKRGTPLRDWIESVVAQMDGLRAYLDTPPSVSLATDSGAVSGPWMRTEKTPRRTGSG